MTMPEVDGAPHVRVETRGSARIITLAREAKRNALARQTVEEIAAALNDAASDETIRGIVVAAEGDVFMAGGDLSEFAAFLEAPDAAERVIEMGQKLAVIETLPVPVICAVAGDVYGGGCEFLLLADAVLAEPHATFSFRHVQMGLSPAWGGASRLLERVGPLAATRLLLTADPVIAKEARRVGLITDVVDHGTALDAACAMVERIARHDWAVVAENKRALMAARSIQRASLAQIEGDSFKSLWAGPAHRAAMSRGRKR
ncbi:MAG: enoyl-CoA hydratase/isomerase family protein [Polyangiaceae bacterium]|nr:enoyl-CoA hydratase/isomerase family protein [Polyangiaceae bacterium]